MFYTGGLECLDCKTQKRAQWDPSLNRFNKKCVNCSKMPTIPLPVLRSPAETKGPPAEFHSSTESTHGNRESTRSHEWPKFRNTLKEWTQKKSMQTYSNNFSLKYMFVWTVPLIAFDWQHVFVLFHGCYDAIFSLHFSSQRKLSRFKKL